MSRRKKIGPVYSSYPARIIGMWLGDKATKIVSSIIAVAVWTGVYYVLLGVVNFNKNKFLKDAKETTVNELFKDDISLIVWAVTSAFICIYVFRSRIGDRQARKKKHSKIR